MSRSPIPTVYLLGTVHTEKGLCTSDELYKIIEQIAPEIIFEELPEALFDRYYNGNEPMLESLEVACIKRYRQKHTVRHFPVDIPVSPNISKAEIEYLFNTFGQYKAYHALEDKQDTMTRTGGFTFLNSKECVNLFEEKMTTEKGILGFASNSKQLLRIYKMFQDEQDNRERKMLQNIYDLTKRHQYRTAVFLIGAAHRKSMMHKIADLRRNEELKLNWIFGKIKKERTSLSTFLRVMFSRSF